MTARKTASSGGPDEVSFSYHIPFLDRHFAEMRVGDDLRSFYGHEAPLPFVPSLIEGLRHEASLGRDDRSAAGLGGKIVRSDRRKNLFRSVEISVFNLERLRFREGFLEVAVMNPSAYKTEKRHKYYGA